VSLAALDWVFRIEAIPSSQKLTLLSLANHASDAEGLAYPSVETICRETGLDKKTARHWIAVSVSDCLVIDTGRRIGRTGQVRIYQFPECVRLPKTDTFDSQRGEKDTRKESRKAPAKGGERGEKDYQKRVAEPGISNQEPLNGNGEASPRIEKELPGPERISFERELERINDRLTQMADRAARDVFGTIRYDDLERAERKTLKERKQYLMGRLGCMA